MKKRKRYSPALVAVLLAALLALATTTYADDDDDDDDDNGCRPCMALELHKNALCGLFQGMAGNPSAEAIALCGDLLFKTVFVTSTEHTGDLKTEGVGATGLEGADNICNLRAQEAGLPGTYTAWLSDSSTVAKDRVTQSAIPYLRTDGVLVANDFTDLLDCGNPNCLRAPIEIDETGGEAAPYWC